MLAFDVGIYDWIKTVHVLAAIVWVGGGVFIQIYTTGLRRANEQTRLMAFARDVEKLGTMVFLPTSIVVLIMGVVLVWYSPAWELTQLWVILGLLGIANTIAVGAFFLGPEAGRLAKIAGSLTIDVSHNGTRSPTSSSRYSRTLTPRRHALARPTSAPSHVCHRQRDEDRGLHYAKGRRSVLSPDPNDG